MSKHRYLFVDKQDYDALSAENEKLKHQLLYGAVEVMGLNAQQIGDLISLYYRLTGNNPVLGVEKGPLPIENAHFLMTAERNTLAAENEKLCAANAELIEAFKELYLCFKTYNDESEVAQRILAKFAKHGGGK